MVRRAPTTTSTRTALEVGRPKHTAAGLTAVAVSMKRAVAADGRDAHGAHAAPAQPEGRLRLPGLRLAGPDPDHRHTAEFCENGAKAVAEEATTAPGRPGVLRRALASTTWPSARDYWLGQQGRLTQPMVRREGATHYEPIAWDDAFALIAEHLNALGCPDEALFYTSGRTSNEAAFGYQLFARAFGTNNLPDCSNMCHESTSVALAETIGIGKGSVSLAGRLRRRADRDQRPEPRHQPPADAHRPGEGQAERRQDPGDQPAARGRADEVRQPADASRAQRRRHRLWPTCTCRSASTATWRCSRRSVACCCGRGWRPGAGPCRPRLHRAAHRRASRRGPSTSRRSTGTPCWRPPG